MTAAVAYRWGRGQETKGACEGMLSGREKALLCTYPMLSRGGEGRGGRYMGGFALMLPWL